MTTLQQDPTPATDLISVLIRPDRFTFSNVLSIEPPVNLVDGLSSLSSSINLVTIALLEKACYSASDVAILAGTLDLVRTLIQLWLSTEDTTVAQAALRFLVKALVIDHPECVNGEPAATPFGESALPRGQGLMWRRMFQDKDVYELFFSICSHFNVGQDGHLSKPRKTIAQARLLDFLKVFADYDMVCTAQMPDIERYYRVRAGGLLQFATLTMIDYKDDVLMHMTLIDFFGAFLSGNPGEMGVHARRVQTADVERHLRNRLSFLVAAGLHARTISMYFEPDKYDSSDLNYLYNASASYIMVYNTFCPSHLLEDPSTSFYDILARLSSVLRAVPQYNWAINKVPRHDLRVLSSLPRVALLPGILLETDYSSLLEFIPLRPTSTAALETLAVIFGGPKYKGPSSRLEYQGYMEMEKSAARLLYALYYKSQPFFWREVIGAAETIALKERALAAIHLIGSVIGAAWGTTTIDLKSSVFASRAFISSNSRLTEDNITPPSGLLAILTTPTFETVIAFLHSPPPTYSQLIGGKGDVESAAYEVAVAKYDVLKLLYEKLKEFELFGRSEEAAGIPKGRVQQTIIETQQRINQGPMGGSSQVGGRVATLEL